MVFFIAVGVRLLHWQDNRPIFDSVLSGLVAQHKVNAITLLRGDIRFFLTGPAPPSDANILTHPPGYPILMAALFKLFSDNETSVRVVQILCDAALSVLVLLITIELFPLGAAVIAGALAAMSPQLSYYAPILLPDSLAIAPVLLALYLIVRARRQSRLANFIAAGALIGVSCWLRSNALLLAPFFSLAVVAVCPRRQRLTRALAIVIGAVVVIAPITIRNWMVFHHFVPISLGAGITLVEGIGDYDKERRFGLAATDLEVVQSEAEIHQRPDYANSLFGVDGLDRERERIERGLSIISTHPFWFTGVLVRRAASMLRLERVATVANEPAVFHSLTPSKPPVWSSDPATVFSNTSAEPPSLRTWTDPQDPAMGFESNGPQAQGLSSQPIAVDVNSDYLVRIPVTIAKGTIAIKVIDAEHDSVLATTPLLNPIETFAHSALPAQVVSIPFVSLKARRVRFLISKEGSKTAPAAGRLGELELFNLGPASYLWTRYPRAVIHVAQKVYLTVFMLPLALIGLLLLIVRGHFRDIAPMLVIPAYYMCFQSFLHTEYRYVMAIQYPLFVLVGLGITSIGSGACSLIKRLIRQRSNYIIWLGINPI